MKYRRLDAEELAAVEKEFVNFLVSHTITSEDWVKIKAESPEKAESLIEIFSDIVFDKVLKKVEFLEHKTSNDIKVFRCLTDKIELVGLQVEGESDLDFRKNMTPDQMISALQQSDAKLQIYQAEKSYTKAREIEVFNMMESGCLIAQGDLYRTLVDLGNE